MRSAISPRLAIRTLSNISNPEGESLDQHESGAILDRLSVGDEDLSEATRPMGADLVHDLHRLDDQERLSFGHAVAEANKGLVARLRREIGGSDHRRLHRPGMLERCGVGLRRRKRRRSWRAGRPGDADATIAD